MYTFVTSFSKDGFDSYAKNMLESVVDKWNPQYFKLIAYYHDFDIESVDAPKSSVIEYRNLNDVEEIVQYRERMKIHDGTEGGKMQYNWRLDAIKWCHKVYAMTELAFEMMEADQKFIEGGGVPFEDNWMIWLDADTVTTKRLDVAKIKEWLPSKADLTYLGRKDADYSETSFMGFNLACHNTCSLLADLRGCYTIGEVVAYREWHDGFIFERLLNIYKAHGLVTNNLSENAKGLAAFAQSPLSEYFTHYKGNLKKNINQVAPDVNAARYKQLIKMVDFYKPKTIVETGTWNGGRAIQMAVAALQHHDKVHYVGFDLFEDATVESDQYEMNTKAHNTVEAINNRLKEFAVKMFNEGKTFTYELHKGDSKVTVPACKAVKDADFAYIDGGHSYETVKQDYENLKHIPVLVFDDFFSEDQNKKLPHEDNLGVNKLTKEIEAYAKLVLPSSDPVLGGGITHLVFVATQKGVTKLPDELTRVPIVVTPKDSRPKEEIIDNVKQNKKLIKDFDWIKTSKVNTETAIIVSGGHSIDFDLLKKRIKETNCKVFCVKHSYPKLLEHGIKPFSCVILDPRPIDGTSTHGVVRKDLFKKVDKKTIFLVASMTDPSVTKYLLSKKANVKGWQAYSDALRDMSVKEKIVVDKETGIEEGSTLITGGTCAAMRTIAIAHTLGFRNFELFGFDCSIEGEMTEEKKRQTTETEPDKNKYMQVELGGEKFWTTGELLAMAQDCEKLFDNMEMDMGINFYGEDTLAAAVWKLSKRGQEKHYSELLNAA